MVPDGLGERKKNQFLSALKKRNRRISLPTVGKAYDFAQKSHREQRRIGGEEFFYHPLQVASMVSKHMPETAVICAALLHDTVEDTKASMSDIRNLFTDDILFLVEALTKIEKYEDRHFNKLRTKEKILHYGNLDERVFIVKLFDVYHNLQTIESLPFKNRRKYAREAYYFYSPIAEELKMKKLAQSIRRMAGTYV